MAYRRMEGAPGVTIFCRRKVLLPAGMPSRSYFTRKVLMGVLVGLKMVA